MPLQKVYDTYCAIIRLPLLRNADDRRRHGSLGKNRVKEYRDATKAQERAKEAERKAQMKAMKARVDEAARKGKEVADAALLAAAKVNEVPQSIAVSTGMVGENVPVVLGPQIAPENGCLGSVANGIGDIAGLGQPSKV